MVDIDWNRLVDGLINQLLIDSHDTSVVWLQNVFKLSAFDLGARLLSPLLVDVQAHLERCSPVTVNHRLLFVEGLRVSICIDNLIVQVPVDVELSVTRCINHAGHSRLDNVGSHTAENSEGGGRGSRLLLEVVDPVLVDVLLIDALESGLVLVRFARAQKSLFGHPQVVIALDESRLAGPFLPAHSAPNFFSFVLYRVNELLVAGSAR